MPRRLLSAAATGLLLVSLAACSEGAEGPVTTPPPSIDAGGSSDGGGESDGGGDPTDAVPDIPAPDPADFAGMDENTPEGAEQAFRYYIAVSMWAHQTGDTAELERLSGPDCGECADLIAEVEELSDDGETWSQTTVTEEGSKAYESENYDHEIGYIYIVSSHSEPTADGGTEEVSEQAYTAIAGLVWREDRWSIDALSIEKTERDL